MKGLILAAGFGTRLKPYSSMLPKPMFRLSGLPSIHYTIENLVQAGCTEVFINTHHLSDHITAYVDTLSPGIPLTCVFEPEILGTGGAIANLRDGLSGGPFWVVNADIFTTISFRDLLQFHEQGDWLATLAVHDYPEFNKITMDPDGSIRSFLDNPTSNERQTRRWAFTGIQVLSEEILEYFDQEAPFSSIDVYTDLLSRNLVKGIDIGNNRYWADIGTPERFSTTSMAVNASAIFDHSPPRDLDIDRLKGDGSDRKWYRITHKNQGLVVSDHGIRVSDHLDEYRAFVSIGNHLSDKQIPVPRIHGNDDFSGQVYLEDLGDRHFQDHIQDLDHEGDVFKWYRKACDTLVFFSQEGVKGFNPQWAFQTPSYDRALIIEKECLYFFNAYLKGCLSLGLDTEEFIEEFEYLAQQALEHQVKGLMHRDFQSRNIMVHQDRLFLIDFQSARLGPLQYDLASLLIDPYVDLNASMEQRLLTYVIDRYLDGFGSMDAHQFITCYHHCCVTRNLQILGAFAFLSQVKGKAFFKPFIPKALKKLKFNISRLEPACVPRLTQIINGL